MLKGICILGIFGVLLFAQSDTASLTGNVTDPSGAAVTGAKVSLRNRSTGSRRLTIIEVKTSVSQLNADTVAQGTVVSQEKIVSLPLNGRQFLQLALLVPGANPGG